MHQNRAPICLTPNSPTSRISTMPQGKYILRVLSRLVLSSHLDALTHARGVPGTAPPYGPLLGPAQQLNRRNPELDLEEECGPGHMIQHPKWDRQLGESLQSPEMGDPRDLRTRPGPDLPRLQERSLAYCPPSGSEWGSGQDLLSLDIGSRQVEMLSCLSTSSPSFPSPHD